jgi:hypothetical protein
LAPASGANDGNAITDAPETATIAKTANALIIVNLLIKSIPLRFSTIVRANRFQDTTFICD